MVSFLYLSASRSGDDAALYRHLLRRCLAPLSCETEPNPNKAKADNHVPCADTRDWVGGLAYVENNDPEEADQEVSDHNWSQPAWALKRSMWLSVKDLLFVSVLFLNFLTQFRLWHGSKATWKT